MQDFESLPLRDIHLPPSPGWWPPAPGWWALAGLLLLLLALAWYLRSRYRRRRVQRAARARLGEIESRFRQDGDSTALAAELSALLRRVSLSLRPRADVAGLTGGRWLAALDELVPGVRLGQSAGRILLEAPYRRQPGFDGEALLRACRAWVDGLPEVRR